jgi:predicted ATPase/DNA-binding SARP family transcriptional activator
VEFRILGPLEVVDDGRTVTMSGARLRRLVVRLALDAGRPVPVRQLVDAVWPQDPPADTAGALQSLVSRLRRALGDGTAVRQSPAGYALAVDPGVVDAHRFESLLRQSASPPSAHEGTRLLQEALALWRGQPLDGADGAEYALGPAARLEDLRLDALSRRIDADLDETRAGTVVAELEDLVASHPLREQFTAQLMRALAATGRTAEALTAYERLRTTLADTLGTDPAPELQQLHVAMLRGEDRDAHAAPATNLPAPRTSFVGRDAEVERVRTLLDAGRLVTVTGPGGAGKTRLATETGRAWLERTGNPVWLVELAPVTSADDLVEAFLQGLDVRETRVLDQRTRAQRDAHTRLLDALAQRPTLLVVDNCEHLVGDVARLVDTLLGRVAGLRVLATSREPLGVGGEALAMLPPLALPVAGVGAGEAMGYAAVRLFVERATAVRADFTLDGESVGDVVEVVRRLDGLPLAIELAAARARVLPVQEIAARLDDRFRLLTGGSRTALPRHQTLRAVVDWSWGLLAPGERLLAERLAVFPSGATARAAEAVCADDRLDAGDVSPLLDSLVDKSIVTVSRDGLRYRMLETIREYGVDRLAERAEVAQARLRHAHHFAALVRRLDPLTRTRDQLLALAELDAERDNILAGLRYLADRGDAAALRMAVDLIWYWQLTDLAEEGATWMQAALEVPPAEVDTELYLVLRAGQVLARAERGETGTADLTERWREEVTSLGLELEANYSGELPTALVMLAVVAMFAGDEELADRAVARGLASGDPWTRAATRMFSANVHENSGNVEAMRVNVEQAVAEFDSIGDRWGLASARTSLAYLKTLDGDLRGAIREYEQSQALLQEIGASSDEMLLGVRLAGLRLRLGDTVGARREIGLLAGRDVPVISDVITSSLLAQIALTEGDAAGVRRSRADLEAALARFATPTPFAGHGVALGLMSLAHLMTAEGETAGALDTVRRAYPLAVATRDMPILAGVGVAVAEVAHALTRDVAAAEVLGACATLRGAEDPTDPMVAALTTSLRKALGDGFDAAYDNGRGLDRDRAVARLDPATVAESSRAQEAAQARRL